MKKKGSLYRFTKQLEVYYWFYSYFINIRESLIFVLINIVDFTRTSIDSFTLLLILLIHDIHRLTKNRIQILLYAFLFTILKFYNRAWIQILFVIISHEIFYWVIFVTFSKVEISNDTNEEYQIRLIASFKIQCAPFLRHIPWNMWKSQINLRQRLKRPLPALVP